MIERKITKEEFLEASERAHDLGALPRSHTKGQGNLAGFLGELKVKEFLPNVEYVPLEEGNKNYDMTFSKKGLRALTVEVKTKRTSVPPKRHYMCSIFASSKHQQWDIVIFTRVLYDSSKIYLLGWLTHKEFYAKAKFVKRGAKVDSSFKATRDCYNVRVDELNPMSELKKGKGLWKKIQN